MINEKIYALVRTGQTRDENGYPIEVSNMQMAEIKLDAEKKRFTKRPHLISDLVVIRHKIKMSPYGCSMIDVVKSAEAVILCDKKPHEWERMNMTTPPAPVGVETSELPAPKTRKKVETNGDV
jgi:hypothetical protein